MATLNGPPARVRLAHFIVVLAPKIAVLATICVV